MIGRLNRRTRLRLWLEDHPAAGILLAASLVAAALGSAWLLIWPHGDAEEVTGKIAALGFKEDEDRGSVPVAVVAVDSIRTRVELPARFGCRTGDSLVLRRRETRWGYSYAVAKTANPCHRNDALFS